MGGLLDGGMSTTECYFRCLLLKTQSPDGGRSLCWICKFWFCCLLNQNLYVHIAFQ